MPDETTRYAVVVVNFDSSALLAENLAPLTRSDPSLLAVVVDNFVDQREREAVEALSAREGWMTVLLDRNVGFGAGMNAGVTRALDSGARAAVLLNPDASLDARNLRVLVGHVLRAPGTMVSPVIRRGDGSVWFAGSDLYLDDGRIRSARRRDLSSPAPIEPWLSGACLAFSRDLWERVGGFDERYFLYWEDVDLSRRVVDAGGELLVASDAFAVHDAGGTQQTARRSDGSNTKSTTYYYYNIRNRMLFASLHLQPGAVRKWLRNDLAVAYEILLQGGRRQFVRPVGPLAAAFRGVRDGRRIARRALNVRREG